MRLAPLALSLLFAPLLTIPAAQADDGMVTLKSAHDVKTTGDRLEKILLDKGMKVFIRINYAEGAKKAGLELRPTETIVFGNPKIGTPLMQCDQEVAIDLPQKALIRQDADGQVWLSYNDPNYLVQRHGIEECGEEVVKKMTGALDKFAHAATAP
ncbi:MAG: DUF302 domain-containing protein [Pseudomonadota bacterium]|nr:DUF302 domain-containing protein [Pseudomonadota bacterium]